MADPYKTPKQVEPESAAKTNLRDFSQKPRVRLKAIQVFWPTLLYLVTFALYHLSVEDSFNDGGGLFVFYVPCIIGCLLVLPAIAIMQLGYGVYQIARRKRRAGWLHAYSSLSLFALLTVFVLYVSAGNYATV
jgi:hypothetical protein